jgi:hypothetical protein
VNYSAEAERQIDKLIAHYRNLNLALQEAEARIALDPAAGLPAPRPYPRAARPGRVWIKARRYWICYVTGREPVIVAGFSKQRTFRDGWDLEAKADERMPRPFGGERPAPVVQADFLGPTTLTI